MIWLRRLSSQLCAAALGPPNAPVAIRIAAGYPSASTISGVGSEGTLLDGMSNAGAGTGYLQHAKADDRYLPKLLGRL